MFANVIKVLIHILEHYAGVLLLATNRVGDFDEPFASVPT